MRLGAAAGCRERWVFSYGFPAHASRAGRFGRARAGLLWTGSTQAGGLLQLTEADDLTVGFSGGPVVDEVTGFVVGMMTSTNHIDADHRGENLAFCTPMEVIRTVLPTLAEAELRPYRGLSEFTTEHGRWFHGRTDAVERVLTALADHRVVLLTGPSGAGKSSLMQAGVLPRLAAGEVPGSDRWIRIVVKAGSGWLSDLVHLDATGEDQVELRTAVKGALRNAPGATRVLLVVDQFEQSLTLPGPGSPTADGSQIIPQLAEVMASSDPVSIVLIVRDDFLPRLAAFAPELLDGGRRFISVPTTLDTQDLRDIIAKPAEDAGVQFQDGLVGRILADAAAIGADSASVSPRSPVLPLLEFTLDRLWQDRHDGRLSHDAYERMGLVAGSLDNYCDAVIAGLPAVQQAIAKRILTTLVHPADEVQHTSAFRRQRTVADLRELAKGQASEPDADLDDAAEEVLAELTARGIIATRTVRAGPEGRMVPVAELVHEALMRDWRTLREWVREDQLISEWLNRVRERQARWQRGRRVADLLTGTELAEGLDWEQRRSLSTDVGSFLRASSQRQRVGIRRARTVSSVLAALLVLALAATGTAFWQRQSAVDAQRLALSRQVAAQSTAQVSTDPELAGLLAIQAYRTSPTTEATASLYAAAASPLRRKLASPGAVTSVAFSADGRSVAAGTWADGPLLWDVATGAAQAELNGHTGQVASIAFSPDGRTLATGATDRTLRLWDAAGNVKATLSGSEDVVRSMAFSPDGRFLATADKAIRLWDVVTGDPRVITTSGLGAMASIAFSPDGRMLATGGYDGKVWLWDVATGDARGSLPGHLDIVASVAFSPDGQTLASGSFDRTVRVWDVENGKATVHLAGHTDSITSVAFSSDGRTLASGGFDNDVWLWDVATSRPRGTLIGHSDVVTSLAFSPDGTMLATGSWDEAVRLWDVTNGAPGAAFSDAEAPVAISPDGQVLATGGPNDTVRLWDTVKGVSRTVLTNALAPIAFSPDGSILATGGPGGATRLWDVATGAARAGLAGDDAEPITSVAFSPDGATLATGGQAGTTRLWDVATGAARASLAGHDQTPVRSVAFSPDGQALATGGEGGVTWLWDVAAGVAGTSLVGEHVAPVASVAFSRDGRTLTVLGSDNVAQLWDVRTGTVSATAAEAAQEDGGVIAVLSPDGQALAARVPNRTKSQWTVRVWDVTTGFLRTAITDSTGGGVPVAFSPDGRTLAVTSDEEVVRLWTIDLPTPAEALARICGAVTRDLSAAESELYLAGQAVVPSCPP
jgi:WD40 repeat protein